MASADVMAITKWRTPDVMAITNWSIQGSARRCKQRASNEAMTAARNSQGAQSLCLTLSVDEEYRPC